MDIKIDPKYYTLISLIIVFFAVGLTIGYIISKQVAVEEPPVTPPATPVVDEPVATITATPNGVKTTPPPVPTEVEPTAVPTEAPLQQPDFTVNNYNPSVDKPTRTIEFKNNRAVPDTLSIRPGNSVLFIITDYTIGSPLTLLLDSSYERNLGTSGAVVVTFNNIGTYNFRAIIPSGDPNIIPIQYATGTITVYSIS